MKDGGATLRLKVPFTEKAEIELKKVGLELVVRVADHKRNIMLPAALASYRPRGAKFEDGALTVTFERRRRQRREATIDEQGRQRETPSEGRRLDGGERARAGAGAGDRASMPRASARSAAPPTSLRATMPAEFQEHWHAWQREMLLAVRSLLDHYIEHLETRAAKGGAGRGHPDRVSDGAASERTHREAPAPAPASRRPPGRLRALARSLDPDQRLAAAAAAGARRRASSCPGGETRSSASPTWASDG